MFASETRPTVVRASALEEGTSEGLPVRSRHVGDAVLECNTTRRIDFALFMVEGRRALASATARVRISIAATLAFPIGEAPQDWSRADKDGVAGHSETRRNRQP